MPDLLHGQCRAGPVRDRRPVYVDLLPPCNAGCPAGENIQAWLAHTKVGDYERAWRQLVADNPFAAIHGRVCYHPISRRPARERKALGGSGVTLPVTISAADRGR